jgi:hypothetical protein
MASFDDDEDLKRAVALSLQHSSPAAAQTSAGNTVDLTSDTEIEDDDVRRAIALSLGEVEGAATPGTFMTAASQKQAIVVHPDTESKRPAVPPAPHGPNVSAGKPIGFLGIDRKAMEQERLARLGKRKRDPSPHRPSKQIAMAPLTKTEHPSSKQVHLSLQRFNTPGEFSSAHSRPSIRAPTTSLSTKSCKPTRLTSQSSAPLCGTRNG